MITKELINRINALSQKQRSPEGLTEAEKQEQARLRQEYLAGFRANMKAVLDQIEIVDELPKNKMN